VDTEHYYGKDRIRRWGGSILRYVGGRPVTKFIEGRAPPPFGKNAFAIARKPD